MRKTITRNIYKDTKNWLNLHKGADEIVYKDKFLIEAVYYSPIRRFKDLSQPNGDYKVPDMDYYNNGLVPRKDMRDDFLKDIEEFKKQLQREGQG